MEKNLQKQLDRLDRKLVDLFEDLKDYTDATLNLPPTENAWSVLEIMQHLMLTERQSFSYIQNRLDEEETFEKAGIVEGIRSIALNSLLSMPFKFKAPFSIGRDAFIKNPTFWEVAKEWRANRAFQKQFLASLPEDCFNKSIYKHNRAGKMTIGGMLSFYEKHFDRHYKQINRTLDAIDACKQL